MSEAVPRKTTVRIPEELEEQIDRVARRLGVSKAGFLTMGASFLLVQLVGLDEKKKRADLLSDVEIIFQRLLVRAREKL